MDSTTIIAFLESRAHTILVLFFVLLGSIGGAVTTERIKALPPFERAMVQLIGFLFVALILLKLIDKEWDIYLLCGLGLFGGLGSSLLALWAVDVWQKSKGPISFLSRLTNIIVALKKFFASYQDPDDGGETK